MIRYHRLQKRPARHNSLKEYRTAPRRTRRLNEGYVYWPSDVPYKDSIWAELYHVLGLWDEPSRFIDAVEDEDIETRKEDVENIGIPEIERFCRKHGYTPLQGEPPITSRYHDDWILFFWNEEVLKDWVGEVFRAEVIKGLSDRGHSDEMVKFFDQWVCSDIVEDMDSDTYFGAEVYDYSWPEDLDEDDPEIPDILNNAHDKAYEEVWNLANKGLDVLEKTCGHLERLRVIM